MKKDTLDKLRIIAEIRDWPEEMANDPENVRRALTAGVVALGALPELIAEIDRLRDALRPFAAAWELNDLDEGQNLAWRNLNIWCTETTDFDHIREPLRGRHLRAAHLALYPNTGDDADTGGDGDD